MDSLFRRLGKLFMEIFASIFGGWSKILSVGLLSMGLQALPALTLTALTIQLGTAFAVCGDGYNLAWLQYLLKGIFHFCRSRLRDTVHGPLIAKIHQNAIEITFAADTNSLLMLFSAACGLIAGAMRLRVAIAANMSSSSGASLSGLATGATSLAGSSPSPFPF